MVVVTKRYLFQIKEEVLSKNFTFDIFSNVNLNKTYGKAIKNCLIMIIYLKYILNDYNYEANLKSHLKKIIGGLTEAIISIVDAYIVKRVSYETYEKIFKKEFIDKFNKLLKIHKINNQKNVKTDLTLQISRNIDSVSTIMKQFLKYPILKKTLN